ncbi:MAG TPA: circularly permuted type 2 ATP-grasp protein [Methylophaga aminisulfidivorans]|uniref:Circularly permuted type 2 ATP-grasp protein n=2 Tax=root TaxID=1 RepID=A0A7C1VPW7_9GAMM|nr:circularly permuted type 2 ATP-grasp protein [Methylophaga aminisulfidivorans]HEC72820.1 circularly permuted type 2 ATP-grasp protein [Methylophaga aminisulfidivorans]
MKHVWKKYDPGPFFDELMFAKHQPRAFSYKLLDYLQSMDEQAFSQRVQESELEMIERGITFTIYSDAGNIDRAWPFDIIPRAIPKKEWDRTEKGLKQRIRALNKFIQDVYNEGKIFKDGIMPPEVVYESKGYRKECQGMTPAHGVWANICGSDLVRDEDGTFYVLEDNLRVPSGVAYMLANRKTTKRVLPELFRTLSISPVDSYPEQLANMLASLRPDLTDPTIAILTPGIFNSAYFEHAYLAQQAGLILLEGADLVVMEDDYVYMKTIHGLERVDVIYRRIDDDFLDPEVFREDSMLGVPGIMRSWKAGKVAIANAPGCGVADDKVIYAFVPDMIRYYLDEEPILSNVPTWLCREQEQLDHVLEHLSELVVKPANESGGYGMLVGPHSTAEKVEEFRKLLIDDPTNYIAQPTLKLSVSPTSCDNGDIAPRHVDLRPFILSGDSHYVTPGGLTRVALVEGSLVVNSSQGGGSKDTWIVDEGQAVGEK